jgi:hypothetical protein
MTPQRIFGAVLLVLGIICVVIGMNSSHSLIDQLTSAFTGHFTDYTTWFVISGVVAATVGLGMVMFSGEPTNPRNR